MGVMVNHTTVTPTKSKNVPVTLMNTDSYNVWIKQPLLAADIVEVDHCPWDYHSTMSRDGAVKSKSHSALCLLQMYRQMYSSVDATKTEMKAGEMETTNGAEQGERPKFGPRPKFNSKNFDFKQELV